MKCEKKSITSWSAILYSGIFLIGSSAIAQNLQVNEEDSMKIVTSIVSAKGEVALKYPVLSTLMNSEKDISKLTSEEQLKLEDEINNLRAEMLSPMAGHAISP